MYKSIFIPDFAIEILPGLPRSWSICFRKEDCPGLVLRNSANLSGQARLNPSGSNRPAISCGFAKANLITGTSRANFSNAKFGFMCAVILFIGSGCVKHIPITPPVPNGFYHKVEKGQTLWRISKAYNTDLETLISANHLSDASKISNGQFIFIPGAKEEKKVLEIVTNPSSQGFIWPVNGKVISFYGIKKNGITSKGINIAVEEGTIVKASKDGKVCFADEQFKGKGKVIIIDHPGGYLTLYAHNSQLLVKPGNTVKRGDPIAKTGKTGRVETSQLYFEIRKGHSAKNPFYYLP